MQSILPLFFNTSYVIIQLGHIQCFLWLLSDFNTSYVVIQHSLISCSSRFSTYFNTSYVVIQQLENEYEEFLEMNFNTSYVVIQPRWKFDCKRTMDFNTSYVVIQPTKNRHSCILLISINHDLKPFFQHFTNHSIENQLFVRNHVFTPFDRLFQKITW